MSRFDTYSLLKVNIAGDFVREKLDFFPAGTILFCEEISSGNRGQIIRVSDEKTGRGLIIRQAKLRDDSGNDKPLSADRGRISSQVFRIQGALCPDQVPKVYLYDKVMNTFIMEDMPCHKLMIKGLDRYETYPQFAEQITDFLVPSLLMTSDIAMDHTDKKQLTAAFTNPEFSEILESLIPAEPVLKHIDDKNLLSPVSDYIIKEIGQDACLRDGLASLHYHFMNHPQALLHGSLRAGSIMISQTHLSVLAPELPFFGPMGYDLGSILADLFFAWANGNALIKGQEDRFRFCGWCMCTIMEIVDLFREKFLALYDEKAGDTLFGSAAFRDKLLSDILSDAAGYAGTECLRRIIDSEHDESLALIEDTDARARAEIILLAFGKELILNRAEMKTAGDYYTAMEKAIRTTEPDNDILGPEKTILDYDTVNLDEYNNALVIIDQTKLPSKIEILSLTKQSDIWDAIYELKVRGAPAIGVAAAIGIYLAAREIRTENAEEYLAEFRKASDYLNSSRPTAVNLSWALKRMEQVVADNIDLPTDRITELLHDEALAIRDEDIAVCRSIGRYGLSLVKPGDGLLTHCNAGQLATVKYGTATAPMYLGHEQGYNFKIYCDETRPLLQGARLTSFELSSAGMDVTVLCDNMSASLMKEGKINAVFVGCDRVAANGDTANKIGTSMVALGAKRNGIPFYVCAPTSTIDRSIATGKDIVIEQRKGTEVTEMWYKTPMAPESVDVYNPAFDVTDADLITGIVTEYGIAYPPYEESIKEIFLRKEIRMTVEDIVKDMDTEEDD